MSIDKAALAFEADMGGTSSSTNDEPSTVGIESLFPSRNAETDITAGGDDAPLPGVSDDEPEPKPRRTAKQVVEGEDVEEDPLYVDDPEDKPAKKDEDGEEEENPDDEENPDEDAEVADIDPDAIVEVTIDGKPSKVTFKEATAGYIRTQTFHQRLSALDKTKDILREEAGVLLSDRKKAIDELTSIGETARALLPKEPNWDELFASDPAKARKLQKDYGDYKKTLDDLDARRNKAIADANELSASELLKFAKNEREKFEDANPHWKADPTKKQKDIASMVRTARAVGFSDAEIAQTLDSRMLRILLEASKYRRMMANKPKAEPRGKTPVNPGAGRTRTAPKGIARSQAQLSRTGRVDDAAAVFQELIRSS